MNESISGQAQDGFCSRCSALDLDDLFRPQDKKNSIRQITNLGKLIADDETANCSMCRLLLSVTPLDQQNSASVEVALYSGPSPSIYGSGTAFYVFPTVPNNSLKAWKLQESGITAGVIALASTTLPHNQQDFLRTRLINQTYVDMKMIGNWLQICEMRHGSPCVQEKVPFKLTKNLYLIDCMQRRVVRASKVSEIAPLRYATLSYVWGNHGRPDNENRFRKTLPQILPQTIEDAIKVTQQLGLQYLWVDRYCIDHRDNAKTQTQIQQMGHIYHRSHVTIIAAAGSDPDFGLPGVSNALRNRQQSASICQNVLASTLPHPKQSIQASKWMKRGWTYQEQLLSCRRLIFTEEQVYYECLNGKVNETINHFDHTQDWGVFINYLHDKHEAGLPWKISNHLKQYSTREFSFEADVIRAFEGVFRHFEYSGLLQHVGLPLLPLDTDEWIKHKIREANNEFAAGLCWRNSGCGERRSFFPSWSWAGWTAPQTSFVPEYRDGLSFEGETSPKISVEISGGSVMDSQVFMKTSLIPDEPLPCSNFIHLESWMIPLHIQYLPDEAGACSARLSTDDDSVNISNYFAVFEDDRVTVQLALFSLEHEYQAFARSSDSANGTDDEELLGVVLGKCESVTAAENTFIMIVKNRGDHFERIGHTVFNWKLRNVIHKTQRKSYEATHPLEICFRSKDRRTIRLG